ncbi:unnamed protein product [Rotaria sp. Silwood2]|nr:unnamed protein product [Rotaria sp. Silwood2]CAF2984982.1 unnamed protein product [Rotaria sp. Silwood2]CAF3274422.1 unnamed protein product [Rotaria sp. Silwood2]CAF3913805.1 unnamed protein product [Rotaria sp. Silwood2]CAF3977669.1 unnamed protein product [Rotaria sp. Silwood2]
MNNKIDDMRDISDGTDKVLQELVQCSLCLRRMRQEVFVKHPNVCLKNPTNKRNVHTFDMTQYRSVKAGDKIIPVHEILPFKNDQPKNINIRPSQTRSIKRDRRSDTLVPPVIDNFCCPICKRKFCEKAYDRHAAFCTSKIKQIQQTPSEEILLARLRLTRRIKFSSNQVSAISSKTSSLITKTI